MWVYKLQIQHDAHPLNTWWLMDIGDGKMTIDKSKNTLYDMYHIANKNMLSHKNHRQINSQSFKKISHRSVDLLDTLAAQNCILRPYQCHQFQH